jgi:hypothetical protein
MKNFVRLLPVLFIGLVLIVLACKDDEDPTPEPASLTAMPFASGLRMPIGFSMDEKGQLWVTEAAAELMMPAWYSSPLAV